LATTVTLLQPEACSARSSVAVTSSGFIVVQSLKALMCRRKSIIEDLYDSAASRTATKPFATAHTASCKQQLSRGFLLAARHS
jgi:hypothetical protein